MKSKKVLNVVSVFFSIPFFFDGQLRHFVKKGYNICMVCSPSDKIEDFARENRVQYKEFVIHRKFTIIQDLITVFKMYKFLTNEKFDVVVGHTPKGGLIAMISSYLAGTKQRIFFRHGLVYETSSGIKRKILIFIEKLTSMLATKVICVSPFLLEKSVEDKLSPKYKMDILNVGSCNGVNAEETFNPDLIDVNKKRDLSMDLGITENDYVIGYVGRIVKDKGIDLLLEAFLQLKNTNKNLKLLVLGPFEDKDSISDFHKDILLKHEHIIYCDNIENNIQYYYSFMNVFVLPTLREGLGTVILEASSMKIPVLTTSHTGSRDAVVNGLTGIYIAPEVDDIRIKLNHCISNEESMEKMGLNGRVHILKNFNQEVIWNEIERKVYES